MHTYGYVLFILLFMTNSTRLIGEDPLLDSLVAQRTTRRLQQRIPYPEQRDQVFLRERDPNALYWGGDGYYPYYYTGHPYYDLGDTPYLWCYYRNGKYLCAKKLYVR